MTLNVIQPCAWSTEYQLVWINGVTISDGWNKTSSENSSWNESSRVTGQRCATWLLNTFLRKYFKNSLIKVYVQREKTNMPLGIHISRLILFCPVTNCHWKHKGRGAVILWVVHMSWSENQVPVLHLPFTYSQTSEKLKQSIPATSSAIYYSPGIATFCMVCCLNLEILVWLPCAGVDSVYYERKTSQKIPVSSLYESTPEIV